MNETANEFVIYLPFLAAFFILSIFIFVFVHRKKKGKKTEDRQNLGRPSEELKVAETLPKPKEVFEIPIKKPKPFAKALASWIPLLREGSKNKEDWEEVLIMSDMGPTLASELIDGLGESEDSPKDYFRAKLKSVLHPAKASHEPWLEHKPWVVYIVGVNGVGKTTTIVKLANYFKKQSKTVGVVGADTFRKAAIEQLERGCHRVGVEFFSIRSGEENSEGADPSAVIFDGLKNFESKDIVLVDTSGRLHTKKNLMEELKKMKRVGEKAMPGAPHDVWLVLDSTLGQNALSQSMVFNEAIGLTGLILTKLDGLSRGGSVFSLFRQLQKPIWFVGKGESTDDLEVFDPDIFVEELFDLEAS